MASPLTIQPASLLPFVSLLGEDLGGKRVAQGMLGCREAL